VRGLIGPLGATHTGSFIRLQYARKVRKPEPEPEPDQSQEKAKLTPGGGAVTTSGEAERFERSRGAIIEDFFENKVIERESYYLRLQPTAIFILWRFSQRSPLGAKLLSQPSTMLAKSQTIAVAEVLNTGQ